MFIVFIGPPGVGKGTQANMLAAKYPMVKISTGDLLREAIKEKTVLGERAKSFMERGELVPDALVIDLVNEKVTGTPKTTNSFIFDGFPRTIEQAKELDHLLATKGVQISMAIDFSMDEEERVSRLSGRRMCPKCQRTYHIRFAKPKNDNLCDVCNVPLIQRSDDDEAVIRQRSSVYWDLTRPLLDFYRQRNLLQTIDASRSIDLVFKDLDKLVSKIKS
ncbi:MAG: adenylate kinase [Nitrospirae bacterium]|jgi:adenylate kinase|uniref:Adenylate kinase n=1 Tax=Leptospirillum ferrodiazotrophum TaxID=412449 RepID=C6HW99_9BACT|nr:MAG: Adenylate kinase [Leptospirillum ferrodiazotrophum]MCL5953780.1 adenylate kinase [Nitrospirota bacterium]